MRAKEFIVEYKTEEYNGLRFSTDIKNGQLIVRALDDWGTNELGHVIFNIGDNDELDPQDLEVDSRYQGQGVAATMYDYVKTLGYEIHRSWDQTPAGAGFWNKHRGEDQRVWEGVDADQVLDYVKRTHAPEEFDIEYSITDHPRWELKNIPLSQLKLDPDGEERDPYNRVNWVDYDVVGELIPRIGSVLKSKPIVVDSQGWIIDGNHRATAAAEAGLTSVPAYVPADVNENFADGKVKGKSRPGRVKRAGASCAGSVTDLRAKAKKYGGERGKMYHWCANMKSGKSKTNESKVNPAHFSAEKLDDLLRRCVKMVQQKGLQRSDQFGRVAACIVDTRNRKMYGITTMGADGKWIHAEQMAIKKYQEEFGKIHPGAIIVTTLSPCNRDMHDRHGPSCQDLLQKVGIERVYTGYMDPTQHSDHPFEEALTKNDDLWEVCKSFSDSFVHQH